MKPVLLFIQNTQKRKKSNSELETCPNALLN